MFQTSNIKISPHENFVFDQLSQINWQTANQTFCPVQNLKEQIWVDQSKWQRNFSNDTHILAMSCWLNFWYQIHFYSVWIVAGIVFHSSSRPQLCLWLGFLLSSFWWIVRNSGKTLRQPNKGSDPGPGICTDSSVSLTLVIVKWCQNIDLDDTKSFIST